MDVYSQWTSEIMKSVGSEDRKKITLENICVMSVCSDLTRRRIMNFDANCCNQALGVLKYLNCRLTATGAPLLQGN